jgi:hypothetical protein
MSHPDVAYTFFQKICEPQRHPHSGQNARACMLFHAMLKPGMGLASEKTPSLRNKAMASLIQDCNLCKDASGGHAFGLCLDARIRGKTIAYACLVLTQEDTYPGEAISLKSIKYRQNYLFKIIATKNELLSWISKTLDAESLRANELAEESEP